MVKYLSLIPLHSLCFIVDYLKQVIPKLVLSFNKAWMVAKQHLVNHG